MPKPLRPLLSALHSVRSASRFSLKVHSSVPQHHKSGFEQAKVIYSLFVVFVSFNCASAAIFTLVEPQVHTCIHTCIHTSVIFTRRSSRMLAWPWPWPWPWPLTLISMTSTMRANWPSFPTAMIKLWSAAAKAEYGTIDGCALPSLVGALPLTR